MSCWFCDSALCTYRFCYCFSVFHFGIIFRSFSRYRSLVSRFWRFLSYDSSLYSSFCFVPFLSPLHCLYMVPLFLLLDRACFVLTLFMSLMFLLSPISPCSFCPLGKLLTMTVMSFLTLIFAIFRIVRA
jgi:hypothetical protein